jgi:hypothetical protein
MILDKISSGKINSNSGSSFSAVEINGDGLTIVNSQDERDSSGIQVLAGSETVLSSSRATGTTINANYIKSGVIDANLMRAGLIQTVPSWNTKWYGAPEDHAAVQIGFTGGSIAATAVSTSTGTVSLTLPGGHGLITGDYVRVSGLYFTTGTLLGSVGLNLPTNGPVDYASATVSTNTLTYSKGDITSGLTASTASTVYVGKAFTVTAVTRSYDDPDNPAELSTVTVTTSAAHGFSVGDYIELAGIGETIDGVAYVTDAPTSTTFTFKQRFGNDIELDLSAADITLPTLGAPVAIKVLKSYTQNADGSIHITSGTVASTLIVGEIAATEITIGSGEGVVRVGSYPDAITPTFQGIWAGSATPSTAEFSVNTAGVLAATSGSIGGFTLSSTSLTAGTGASAVGLLPGTFPFFAGNSTASSAPFRVASTGDLTATNVTIIGTDTTINTTNTGKLTLQPSLSQGASLILTDGTLVKSAGYTATRNTTTGNVVVTYTGTDILVGMFITTATTPANFYVLNAKVTAVTPGVSFTYQMPTGTTASGTITSFTAYKSLQFLGGGLTRFQQTTGDAGAVAAGSLILGNNAGLNNIGTASLVIPADGELVFNTVLDSSTAALTPKYIGGGNLFQSATNVLETSGDLTVDGVLTASSVTTTLVSSSGDISIQAAGGDLIVRHGTSGTTPRILLRRGDATYNAGIQSDAVGDINFYSGSGTSTYADLYMDQLLPNFGIPMSAISGMTTVSDAISSSARWHQPASGARWELKRSSSSQRYKNTIQYPEDEFLSIARNIRPRFFKRNDETAGRRHLGFIAEEVHAAGLLEAVTYWDDGAGIMIDGIEPTAILATALLRIKDLEDRLAELEGNA